MDKKLTEFIDKYENYLREQIAPQTNVAAATTPPPQQAPITGNTQNRQVPSYLQRVNQQQVSRSQSPAQIAAQIKKTNPAFANQMRTALADMRRSGLTNVDALLKLL